MLKKLSFILILTCFFSLSSHAQTPLDKIASENFDQLYQQTKKEYGELKSTLPSSLKKRTHSRHARPRVKKSDLALSDRYTELKELMSYYEPTYQLREELKTLYLEKALQSVDEKELHEETTDLAIGLMQEMIRLRQQYKSFFIPIFHNMMIDVGIKDRGACKHWASDLLKYLKTTKRKYFFVTWGESYPRKFNEHNVAVIYPKYAEFKDGLIIDPWRTGGKPHWVRVKDDHHYKWHKWAHYGIY